LVLDLDQFSHVCRADVRPAGWMHPEVKAVRCGGCLEPTAFIPNW
jgi:hypothetical protein